MTVNIYGCILACVLASNVAAETRHVIIHEKDSVSLSCPSRKEGKVTWSRGSNGRRVDILYIDGDRDVRPLPDPNKQYSSLADYSLYIFHANASSDAEFFCNNVSAADVTVIPSGAMKINVREGNTITLPCPSDGTSLCPTWGKAFAANHRHIRSLSTVDKTFTITNVQLSDSGLYLCDGKPAAYLHVFRG